MICDYKDQLEYKPLQDGDPLNDHQITGERFDSSFILISWYKYAFLSRAVCVRKRPLSQKECKRKEIDVTTCPNRDQVKRFLKRNLVKKYTTFFVLSSGDHPSTDDESRPHKVP